MAAEVSLDPIFAAFAVPAIVTAPGGAAVLTQGVWVTPITEDAPGSAPFHRRQLRRAMALRLDALSYIPRGTLVVAPNLAGGPGLRWLVDGFDHVDVDHVRVNLVTAPAEDT